MNIEKKYFPIEKVEEVKIYDLSKEVIFYNSPKVTDVEPLEFESILNQISSDVNQFMPVDNGEDLIVTRFGKTLLQRLNINPKDILGRRFSECLPFYHDLFKEHVKKVVNKKSKIEKLRLLYFEENTLSLILTTIIMEKNGYIYIINNYESESITKTSAIKNHSDKLYLIEYMSQTGSYYKINNKYAWTNGIYNILGRHQKSSDKYYNIIFDLALKEDKEKIKKSLNENLPRKMEIKEKIRIKTENGKIKTLECNLYPKYNNNEYVGIYGFFKDISSELDSSILNPIDYILNGFTHSQKLALLLEPFNPVTYSFTDGFYNIIGVKKQEYTHNYNIYKHIGEKKVVEKLKKMESGEVNKFDETFTFYKDKTTKKPITCELILENFYVNNELHTIGFLIDITHDIEKREHIKIIEKQRIIIKEVHHRIKNNLQILNSFINLEKREYSKEPELIIEHMQSRLNSLSILHAQTCESLDFENLNVSEAITQQEETLNNLLSSHNDINFITCIDPELWMPISLVTPLLLIINELTTNSVKHAFNDNTKNKQIYKHMKLIDGETCEFVFKDNGIGLKDTKMQSLGSIIIKSLIKQINGTLELTVNNGTQFEIKFPINQEYVGYK